MIIECVSLKCTVRCERAKTHTEQHTVKICVGLEYTPSHLGQASSHDGHSCPDSCCNDYHTSILQTIVFQSLHQRFNV